MTAGITRWSPFGSFTSDEPFSGFLSLRNAMDRLFQDAFVRPSEVLGWSYDGQWHLPIDLYETEEDCVVKAAVPGVRPEDLNVSVQGNVLTIRGETRGEHEESKGSYHLRERRYGTFYRQVQLPVPVNADAAQARFENGILTLKLPKAEEARERRIQITSGSEKAKAGKAA